MKAHQGKHSPLWDNMNLQQKRDLQTIIGISQGILNLNYTNQHDNK